MDKKDKKSKLEQELGQTSYKVTALKQQFELEVKRLNELTIELAKLYKKEKPDAGKD